MPRTNWTNIKDSKAAQPEKKTAADNVKGKAPQQPSGKKKGGKGKK